LEYALIVALVALVALGALVTLGGRVRVVLLCAAWKDGGRCDPVARPRSTPT
jgi:hypothetical protein